MRRSRRSGSRSAHRRAERPGIPSTALPTQKVCGRDGQGAGDSLCSTAGRQALPEPWIFAPGTHMTSQVRGNLHTALARTREPSGCAEIVSRRSACEGVLPAELPGSPASVDGAESASPDFHPAQAPGRHLGGCGEPGAQGREAPERHGRGTLGERALPANDHRGTRSTSLFHYRSGREISPRGAVPSAPVSSPSI